MKYSKNWNHWNVSLWINNDQGLYNLAKDMMRQTRSIYKAADAILNTLQECGITHTPDGAKYSRAAIVAALRGWR